MEKYKRQLIIRKPLSGSTITKFNESLNIYFSQRDGFPEKGEAIKRGLPSIKTVRHIASKIILKIFTFFVIQININYS